ncbi:hypothetical protein SAMN05216464_11034 [Mucilaginibacter pineti]|uniref:Uncharacterized protein n=1 Tax=Mucilaginibacter pineti TaxID=1391627 RepID=A0A1G7G9G4_9SPHI|nr:hypothetical protein SAMN05216464_11034 [Mucilaginibacter pineti]
MNSYIADEQTPQMDQRINFNHTAAQLIAVIIIVVLLIPAGG